MIDKRVCQKRLDHPFTINFVDFWSSVQMTGGCVHTGRFIVKQCQETMSPLMYWSVKMEEMQTVRHLLRSCAVNKPGLFTNDMYSVGKTSSTQSTLTSVRMRFVSQGADTSN